MTAKVTIVLEAINKSSKEIDKATASISKMRTQMNSAAAVAKQKYNTQLEESRKKSSAFSKKLPDLARNLAVVTAGIVAVGFAARKAFDFAKEGAQLEFVERKFDNLSASIDRTSSALLIDLRAATSSMFSDSQLMKQAGDFVALGLANTSDEVLRLSKVSAALNFDMNELTLTLTNKTTRRFDALGVRVEGFKEKVKDLTDAGMDADAAFKEAFLQQAEAQLELVGDAADSALGTFNRFEAGSENLTTSVKKIAAVGLTPLLSAINKTLTPMAQLIELGFSGKIAFTEYAAAFFKAQRRNFTFAEALAEVQDEAGLAEDNVSGLASVVAEELEPAVFDTAGALKELKFAMGVDLFEDADKTEEKLSELRSELEKVTMETNDLANREPWEIEDIEAGREKMAEVAEEIVKVEEAWERQTAQMLFNLAEQRLAIGGFTEEEIAALTRLAGPEGFGLIDQRGVDLIETIDEMGVAGIISSENLIRASENSAAGLETIISAAERVAASISRIPTAVNIGTTLGSAADPRALQGFGIPGRASGGSVTADQSFLVGERGPEIFTPQQNGNITPNNQIGGFSGGGSSSSTVIESGAIVINDRESGREMIDMMQRILSGEQI